MKNAREEAARKKGFNQGFSCAVGTLISGHGRSTMSDELFGMIGDYRHVDEYDKKIFKECGLWKTLKNKRES